MVSAVEGAVERVGEEVLAVDGREFGAGKVEAGLPPSAVPCEGMGGGGGSTRRKGSQPGHNSCWKRGGVGK